MKSAANPTATAMSRPNRAGFDTRPFLGGETNWRAVVFTAGSPAPLPGERERPPLPFHSEHQDDASPFRARRRPEDPMLILCPWPGWILGATWRRGDEHPAGGHLCSSRQPTVERTKPPKDPHLVPGGSG